MDLDGSAVLVNMRDCVGGETAVVVLADCGVLVQGHLVEALQSVVDPAALALLWPNRSGLVILALALEGKLVALPPVRVAQVHLSHLAMLDRAVLVRGKLGRARWVVDSAAAAVSQIPIQL